METAVSSDFLPVPTISDVARVAKVSIATVSRVVNAPEGVRATLRGYLGVAAGFYDGNPSMGAEVDLIFLRLAATTYKRELGDRPGVNSRQIIQLSLSAGF